MARQLRRLAVALPVSGVLLVAAAGPAAAAPGADPPAKPHQADATGNPHVGDASGDPHQVPEAEPTPTTTTESPPATTTDASTPTASTAPAPSNDDGYVPITVSTAPVVAAAKPNGDNNGHGGKPCDGCVGNADGKQPPGQSKGKGEKGHRCDGNKGIGRGNPAHSACEDETTTTNTTTPTTTTTDTTPDTTTSTDDTDDTAVLGETTSRTTKVLGVQLTRGALARTGTTGDPLDLTVVALGLVLAGRVLVKRAARTA